MNRQSSSVREARGTGDAHPGGGFAGRVLLAPVGAVRVGVAPLFRLLTLDWSRTAMIAIAVFAVDVLAPGGVPVATFYMAAVLSAVPIRYRRAVRLTAVGCSLLVLGGWIASAESRHIEWWNSLVNRSIALGVIWAAAAMAESWRRLQDRRFRQIQESRLLQQATMLSVAQFSFFKALESSLQALCEVLGWAVGHVYLHDSEGRCLVSTEIWRIPEEERFQGLRAAARDLRFARGEGVPGRVWQEGEPIAVADVADSSGYAWLAEPKRLGIRGAFALPIVVAGETVAVMEFFSEQRIDVDFEFMPLARNIGQQLGRLFERRRADELVRQSEERLRLAVESSGMGAWEWWLETDRMVWSPELERIYGLEPGTFEGTLLAACQRIHPDDRPRVEEAIREAVMHGRDFRAEYRIIRRDGAVRWIESRGAISADADGRAQHVLGVLMDITERMDAEIRNARLAAIVQSSDDAILAKSLDGTILTWNAGAERIYGYTADEIVGKPICTLVPDGQPDDTRTILERIVRGERVDHYETLRRRKDGRIINISLSAAPIKDSEGNVVGAAAVARDETERRAAELEMKKAHQQAESANRSRSRFLANMSHELRTPMNSILGMLQLALASDTTPEVHRWLITAKAEADSLLLLLNDLLDLSKIEADKLMIQHEPFELRKLLDVTARSLATRAFEKGVELLVDVGPDVPKTVTGDGVRLRQVLTNLITNGIKFTKEGEVVMHAALEGSKSGETVVRFSVTDTGVGIAPEDQRRIFEPFIQSDATAATCQGGAGLGLSIADELVRRMGGVIQLQSTVGQGSCFSFALPLPAADDSGSRDWMPEPEGTLEGVPVLIVERNTASRELLVKVLNHWSMQPDAVVDGDRALETLRRAETQRRPYRLVIANAAMMDGGGVPLLDRIAGTVTEAPPLVLLHRPGAVSAHCDELPFPVTSIEKPISPEGLLEAITRMLGVRTSPAGGKPRSWLDEPPLRVLSVLVAEDTRANQEVAVSALRRRGHSVTTSDNGRQAVDLLAQRHFDVVLMDVTMPVMNGYEATSAIRQREQGDGRHVPIIAVTAHASRDIQESCKSAGMDAYLRKPVDIVRLVEMVEKTAEKIGGRPSPGSQAKPSEGCGGVEAALHPRLGNASDAPDHADDSTDVMDYQAAVARLGGDTSLFRKIVAFYQEDTPGIVQTIGESIRSADPQQLKRAAHSLKGLAANFGARSVVELASLLEEMGNTGRLEGAEQLFSDLRRAMEQLDSALAPHGRQGAESEVESATP